jgi:hypothetical protein
VRPNSIPPELLSIEPGSPADFLTVGLEGRGGRILGLY